MSSHRPVPAVSRPILAILAVVLALGACGEADRSPTPTAPVTTLPAPAGSMADVPSVVEALRPSVVSVLREDGGSGSGVIWRADGLVVTNDHVVDGAGSLGIRYSSGQEVPAEVVASDPRTDVALLRVDDDDLPAAVFRDDLPAPGDLAIAIGAPLGFDSSVTVGVVSGLGRAIPGSARQTPALVDLIQTDAGISPGNSGGALADIEGRIIGLNVAHIPPSTGAVSIGFAIPSAVVLDVAEQLADDGTVEHPYIGVQMATLDRRTAEAHDLAVSSGAVILAVDEGGPAAEAGLHGGDIIVGIGEVAVRRVEDVLSALRSAAPGDTREVRFLRDDDQQTVEVRLAELPAG